MKIELGHYKVNGIVYPTKILAILEAQRTKADIEWYFFDDVFNKVNWLEEPITSLDDFYKMRAMQIREAYDYVIVFCSGGADSTNVVKSFLENNIHVDEVIAMAPLSGLSNFQFNDKDTSAENTISETKYAQLPLMHEIATKYPNVRTTIIDSFKSMINAKSDEWVVDCQGDFINSWTHAHSRLDEFSRLTDMAEAGKRIAVVNGIDKPVLTIFPNGDMYTMMSDIPINIPKQPFRQEYPNVDRVLFYWSPDLPEMIVKQAHVIAREIVKPENKIAYKAMVDLAQRAAARRTRVFTIEEAMKKMLPSNRRLNDDVHANVYNPFAVYERSIVPFIYAKTYTKNLFQANKAEPNHTFFARTQDWFHELHGNTRANQLFESDFLSFYKSIDTKYLNKSLTGFFQCIKTFKIGNVSTFKQPIII
jgi:hypothetical protein